MSGTHDDLLARGGAYRALYRDQFGDGEIETRCADGVIDHSGRCVPYGHDGHLPTPAT